MKEIMMTFLIVGIVAGIIFLPGAFQTVPVDGINYEEYLGLKNTKKNTSNTIAFDMDLRTSSAHTADEYNRILVGTPLSGLGSEFKKCDDIGVNSLFMLALAWHESAGGTSALARDKNNLFGFRAYDRSPYESATTFSSKADCIERVSQFINTNYLSEKGIYHHGYTITAINQKYATDQNWARKVYERMELLESRM